MIVSETGFAVSVKSPDVIDSSIDSVSTADVLVAKFVSPLYAAVIEWFPSASDDVVYVAVRFEVRFDFPSAVAPSKNSTDPVGDGAAELDGLTVAVNVTLAPSACGLALEEMVVAVAVGVGCTIDSTRTPEVLPEKLVSPL